MNGRGGDPSFEWASRGARTFPGVPEENYWFRRHQAAYGLAARAVRDMGAGRILDVGCGEGYGSGMLAQSARVDAIELDGAAALHAATTYPGVGVVRGDACALPYRATAFHAVVAMQVLEHLFCADRFIREIRTILGPGGALLLSTPNRETFSRTGEQNAFHVYEYAAEELEALLRVHFRKVRLAGLHHGVVLRAADRAAGGSLQHRLISTPFDELPPRLRMLARAVRSRHFRVGPAEGSLDLLAIAERGGGMDE